MKPTPHHIAGVSLCAVLLVAPIGAEQNSRSSPKAAPQALVAKPPESLSRAKVVAYNAKELVPVRTQVRFVTLIVLPEGEEILEIACGDKDFWTINGTQNLAYVKPAQEGLKTNLNLVTASGNIYSFILTEASGVASAEPDLKVVIEPREGSLSPVTPSERAPSAGAASRGSRTVPGDGTQKFVSVRELEEVQRALQAAQEETRKARESTQEAIAAGVRKFVSNMRFAYRFEAGRKPFYVRAMGHDERFTYIHARPEETPTLYEIKDGKPNLVSFDYQDGIYVISKILGSGYLAIGKQRLPFERQE